MTAHTLNDLRVTHARVMIPAWGVWWAEVSLDGEHTLAGVVTLKIADLALSGTIVSGGPAKGRSQFRIAAGAAGWGRDLPRLQYTNDAGVKQSKVLLDAAALAGESFGTAVLPTTTVGVHYVRESGPASQALQLLAPEAWYVGEDGVTRLGRRPAVDLAAKAAVGPINHSARIVPLAAEEIATILPGIRVEGLEAVDVLHDVSPDGVRSTLWCAPDGPLADLRKLKDQAFPEDKYRGSFEYRVVTQEGERFNLQAVRVSTGMPDLRRVVVRPGVPGCRADVMLGSRVIVSFLDASPARPYVHGFEDAEGEGFLPDLLELNAEDTIGLGAEPRFPVARATIDTAGPYPISGGSLKVSAQ